MSDVHVVPIADLREHDDARGCWCRPLVEGDPDDDCLVVHHALDGREWGEPGHEPLEAVQ